MPYVNGVFTRVDNSFSEPVEGTTIEPIDAISLFDDYDSGLTQALGGVLNVKSFGATGDGATNDYAAIQAAIDASTGNVFFPAGDYLINSPLNLDDTIGITLTGESSTTTSITYPGAVTAISARSSTRFRLTELLVLATESDRVIDLRSNVTNNTASAEIDHCVIQHVNIGHIATRIGIDCDNNESVSIVKNSMAISYGIDIQGVSAVAHYVIGLTISRNAFGAQTTVNHIKAPGSAFLIERNEIETGTAASIAKGPAGTSTVGTLQDNWMGDGGVVTYPLVTSNSQSLVSISNTYATSIGGGGASTCIQQDNSTGSVTSIGDYLEADVGIAIGTGNYLRISNPDGTHPPTALYSGTPANTNVVDTVGGAANITGKLGLGLSGVYQGVTRYWNDTAGTNFVELIAPSGVIGGCQSTLPVTSGALLNTTNNVTVTLKVLDNSNTVTLKDTLFTLQDDGDTTKQARFQLSGITTATTRTYTLPDANMTFARSDAAQTFTGTQTFGALVATTVNGNTVTTGTGTLTLGAGKTATISNTLTFTGTDGSSVAFGTGGTVQYSGVPASFTTLAASAGVSFTGGNLTTTFNSNAENSTTMSNPNAGLLANATFIADNGTSIVKFGMRGLNATAYGALAANTGYIYAAVDFEFMSDGGKLVFCSGGNAEKMRLTTTGGLALGTTTDPGSGGFLASASVKSKGATSGIGYDTGAGGAVTQITSRTTGVTLNTICGAITLFSAAGTTTWQTFVVTNSAVAATDTIVVCQKSGADLVLTHVAHVQAGSFNISFATTGGTSVDQPVFNFAIIKAVTS